MLNILSSHAAHWGLCQVLLHLHVLFRLCHLALFCVLSCWLPFAIIKKNFCSKTTLTKQNGLCSLGSESFTLCNVVSSPITLNPPFAVPSSGGKQEGFGGQGFCIGTLVWRQCGVVQVLGSFPLWGTATCPPIKSNHRWLYGGQELSICIKGLRDWPIGAKTVCVFPKV